MLASFFPHDELVGRNPSSYHSSPGSDMPKSHQTKHQAQWLQPAEKKLASELVLYFLLVLVVNTTPAAAAAAATTTTTTTCIATALLLAIQLPSI